jgi:hypothetical protein
VLFADSAGNRCVPALHNTRDGFLRESGTDFANSPGDEIAKRKKELDPSNTDEQVVLGADYFAFYKGVPVFRTNGNRSGSFGVLFITRETNERAHPEDMVRHEYGHVVQLKQLGVVKYAVGIMIPSWLEWDPNPNYYARRCEITADIFGGVESRTYTLSEICLGYSYLQKVDKQGIGAWLDFL